MYTIRPLDTDELRIGIEFMRSTYPSSLVELAALPEQVSYFQNFVTELSGGLFEVAYSDVPIGPLRADLEQSLHVKDYSHSVMRPRAIARENLRRLLADKHNKGPGVQTRWVVQVIHETVRDYLMKDGMCHLPGKSLSVTMDLRVGHLHLYQMCRRILATDEMSCALSKEQCRLLHLSHPPNTVQLGMDWLGTTIADYVLENTFWHLRSSQFFDSKDQCGLQWELLSPSLQCDVLPEAIKKTVLRWECIRPAASKSEVYGHFSSEDSHLEPTRDRDLGPVLEATGFKLEDFQVCASDGHVALLAVYRRSLSHPRLGSPPIISASHTMAPWMKCVSCSRICAHGLQPRFLEQGHS
ncbi:hypothetical protein AYL99_11479 [Fonsecaea erecta]|uniref:Uncharacterized protein n=1 Tax=Fonsecaea erecta TaxID=1367422 RepID=A0A178Z3R3_9EURO|nr:hypothetical protein AYL99_11479 [Fonsecaea erecta]OAP54378.1 hypothetical protein AYL99_11479 [Fonsecaea erecta]